MVSKRAWPAHPATFRARELKILADWIRSGESGSVVGLPGAGKSNLLGFLCYRSEVIRTYIGDANLKLILAFIDLNNLPGNSLSIFYRVILRGLYEVRTQFAAFEPSLASVVENFYGKVEEKTDPFLSQSALRELFLLFQEKGVRLVIVLDPFDQFCRAAKPQLLDNLRGLRDGFKTTLSYLVGLRHELKYLRDPVEMGELYEILDTHICWLGAMAEDDAYWLISCMEEATGQSFSKTEQQALINLTGGYPALLRVASLWLAASLRSAESSFTIDARQWIEALLVQPYVRNRLHELWQGLTGEERLALAELQASLNIKENQKHYEDVWRKHSQVLISLQQKRVCFLNPEKNQLRTFNPLLAAYIDRMGIISSGTIRHRPEDDTILKGNLSLEDQLTPQGRKLLLFFLDNPRKILSKDDIAYALWSESEIISQDKGIEDQRLQKAVSDLRMILQKDENSPEYIQTQRGIGYRFFPEGAPV